MDRTFHSGERIQLLAETNFDGYLAIVHLGSDGTGGLIYPEPSLELTSNQVQAHQTVILPGPRHYFRFDQQPGTERLFLILARSEAELGELALSRRMDGSQVAALRHWEEREEGAKNLLVEAFSSSLDDPATYAVHRRGAAIIQEICLTHRP